MNERIEIVTDTKVSVCRFAVKGGDRFSVWVKHNHNDNLIIEDASWDYWDAEGRAALIDVLQCLRDTGSFAALADTSAVPFVGKRMRDEDGEVTVLQKIKGDGWWIHDAEFALSVRPTHQLRRLAPPKPKVKPWTAEQGFREVPPNTHIIDMRTGEDRSVTRFKSWSGGWSVRVGNGDAITPEQLAEHYQKDGSACGVVETE